MGRKSKNKPLENLLLLEDSTGVLRLKGKKLSYSGRGEHTHSEDYTYFHLYLYCKHKIEESDYFYDSKKQEIVQCLAEGFYTKEDYPRASKGQYKLIASSDFELDLHDFIRDFLKRYINAYNSKTPMVYTEVGMATLVDMYIPMIYVPVSKYQKIKFELQKNGKYKSAEGYELTPAEINRYKNTVLLLNRIRFGIVSREFDERRKARQQKQEQES